MPFYNPSIFKGEQSFGTTPGAPLSTDSNNKVTSGINAIEVSSTATATATTSDALMTGMSITPAAGTYIVWFTCDINSANAGVAISVSIYVNGVQDPSSLRKIIPFSGGTLTSGSGRGSVAINRTVVVTTGDVEIRWSGSSAGSTAAARVLTLLRIL